MRINEDALNDAYTAWEPYTGTARDESVIRFGDIRPLVALAADHGVLPVPLAAYDVGMDHIVLMWCLTDQLWLHLWDGDLSSLTTVEDGVGLPAVRSLFETIAGIADRECRTIAQSPRLEAIREAQTALEAAKNGDSNDEEIDAGHALSEQVTNLLGLFTA